MLNNASILAAFDGSDCARWAAERAALIARRSEARLDIAQVVNQGALDDLRELLGVAAGEVEQRLVDQVQACLQDFSTQLQEASGVSPATRVFAGSVLDCVLKHAEDINAGLLVLGAHGSSLVRNLLLGSTVSRVLRKTCRPMLIVHQPPTAPYRRVLVPVDFSSASGPALALATTLAPDAEIVLFHAFEIPFEGQLRYAGVDSDRLAEMAFRSRSDAETRLHQLALQHPLQEGKYRRLIEHGEASRLIVAAAADLHCDLIVMGKRGRGQVEEWLLGSSTKHVLSESPSDVAIVHA